MNKSELRKAMLRQNRSLSPELRARASEALIRHVEHLPVFAAAHTVALFCSLLDEPDTREALNRWSKTKRLVVPRVEGNEMQFYEFAPATLCTGAFGICEPGPGAVRCRPDEIDLILVPGVAFTANGLRMGRGRGYYDKYLSQTGIKAAKVGVCYAHQLVDNLPVEPHDVAMDCVVWG